jgi:hypothetical protein
MQLGDNVFLIPILLMLLASPLGAFDVLYFHIFKFRLYARPESRTETLTHLMRSILFLASLILLVLYEPHGVWFWAVGSLFVFDFINNLADVYLEAQSRKQLGGLPLAESMIHIVGTTFAGAISISYFVLGARFSHLPTALIEQDVGALHILVYVQAILSVFGGLAVTALESYLYCYACTERKWLI